MHRYLCFVFFLLVFHMALSQRTVKRSSLYWFRYQANVELKNDFSLSLAAESRNFTDTFKPNLRLYSADVIKELDPNWTIALGVMEMSAILESGKGGFVQYEVRPYLYLLQRTVITSKLALQNRYRFEERIRQNVSKESGEWSKAGGMYAYERYRFRSQLTYQLTNNEAKFPVSLVVGDELIVHFGDDRVLNTFDQNRVYAQLRVKVLPTIDLTVGYTNLYSESQSTAGEYSDTNNWNIYINQRF